MACSYILLEKTFLVSTRHVIMVWVMNYSMRIDRFLALPDGDLIAGMRYFSSGISTGSSRGSQTPQYNARAVTIALWAPRTSLNNATIWGISWACSLQIARPQKAQVPWAGRSQCQQFILILSASYSATIVARLLLSPMPDCAIYS
jgi:hypothetical protein